MEDVDAIMKKYDRESNTRVWEGTPPQDSACPYGTVRHFPDRDEHVDQDGRACARPLFLGLVIILVFIYLPIKKALRRSTTCLGTISSWRQSARSVSFFYPLNLEKNRVCRYANPEGLCRADRRHFYPPSDRICNHRHFDPRRVLRRVVGMPIICVATVFVLYAFLGAGKDLKTVMYNLFYTTTGILGTPIGVCSTYIRAVRHLRCLP